MDNTFIIFTSDNGGHYGITRQLPLRSGKGSYCEGGIREPMFVRWPEKVIPGTKTDIPVTNLDFFPTILEVAGIKKPVDKILDGQSIMPVLTGIGTLKERPLFWHFPVYLQAYLKEGDPTQDPLFRTRPGSAVRLGDWKLIQYFENNDIELYNLNEDISEKNNLARTNPLKVKELLGLLEEWRAKTNAPVPTELNPEYAGVLKIFNSPEEQRFAHSMLETFVNNNTGSCFDRRDSILSGFRSPADWQNYQKQVRDKLSTIFGEFPEKTPLNPRIISRKDYSDYYMEKVIYESQPDYYVPANLYIPKNRNFPLPGVLFTIGHSDEGKGQKLYHETCLGLVKKGYVVLAADPIGQGERSEYFDPKTMQNLVRLGVNQHHYVGRPAFLADWSLSGIRTWDCIRAVDYLVSRPEIDTTKLAVTGNSGGGQMALLTAAVDTRIKVVAAAHPGGSMENTYLTGQTLTDRDVLCLIPPRPCRMIVGDASGEQEGHTKKLNDMARFYKGLGANDDHWDMDIVEGVHDMKQSKRESAYEWLNLWFDKVEEGKEEPVLTPEDPRALWCTENGNTLNDLGGESGQTLIQKRMEQIYNPAGNPEELKKNILNRLHLKIPANEAPVVNRREIFTENNISVEKFTYTVEKNIEIPSLLLRPVDIKEREQLIFHISDKGKPDSFDSSPIIFALVKEGFPVLSVDVRGTGETATSPPVGEINRFTGYTPDKWKYERLAIQSASFRRTMDGMRALDVIKGIDLINSRMELKDKSIIMLGEGSGGLWALLAHLCRPDVQKVISLYTLPSYKFLIAGKYYDQHGYFWVPGAIRDYDIPDLAKLADPKRQLWINPVNELSEVIFSEQLIDIIPKFTGINICNTKHEETDAIIKEITEFIDSGL